jgi:hypothetical protein
MVKQLLFSLLVSVLSLPAFAQPSAASVIKRLTHAGVTKVEVVKTVKEWKDGKYIYVAYANVIKAVAPEKVFGLKGVTLVIATMAYYDIGASQPYQVLGSESNGEYRGINLPVPSNPELTKFATEAAQKNPEKFFMQAYTIVAIEKISVTNPKAEWLHPGKLKFEGTIVYVDRLTRETFQRIEAPCTMELHRNGLTEPWYLGKGSAETMQARYTGDIIHAADAPQWVNLPGISDRAAEHANKEKITAMGFTAPPVFASGKELAVHINEKLHTLSKEQFAVYMTLLLHSSLKQTGTTATPNGNGQQLIDHTVLNAYDGWGKYKDQYCPVPDKFETVGLTVYWYNKRYDRKCDVNAVKEGNTYTINGLHIFLDKKQEDDAAFKTISCAAPAAIPAGGSSTTSNTGYQKGDKVLVEENGKWYPATVLDTRPGEWYIHYDGYSSQYDLWVGPARIKQK